MAAHLNWLPSRVLVHKSPMVVFSKFFPKLHGFCKVFKSVFRDKALAKCIEALAKRIEALEKVRRLPKGVQL